DDSDPLRLFNTHLEGGTLTKELALSHLKALTKMTHYGTGSGEATIKWMWNEYDKYDDSKVDRDLLEQTIRHLVREGKEELAWSWIEQESRRTNDSLNPGVRFIWRAATASALVAAKAFSADHDNLDGALETFFRAKSSSYSIPLSRARTNIATLLMMPREKMVMDSTDVDIEVLRWPNTSTELWETFLESIDGEVYSDEALSVQLSLYHPRVPNAFPYLEHCRYLAEKKAVVTRMVRKPSVIPWTRQGLHAEAVLRQQGHEQHADWLGDFVRVLYKRSKWIRKKEETEGRRW
ncbi:hypothetical protein M436DRAFT_37489, partial [Aureobasidium namibiae CBS 147.97]